MSIDVAAEADRLNVLSLALVDAYLGGDLALAEILRRELAAGREELHAEVRASVVSGPGGLP